LKGEKSVAVVDGRPTPELDRVSRLIFSPDSRRVAYVAQSGEDAFVVADGQAGLPSDGISDLIFSPDSKCFTYVAKWGDNWGVVTGSDLNDEPQPGFAGVLAGSLVFSPDGRHLAYVADMSSGPVKEAVVLDGRAGPVFDKIDEFPMSIGSNGALEYFATFSGSLWHVKYTPNP